MNNTPSPAANPGNGRGKVVVSHNPVRQRVFIDKDGNEVSSLNPRNRQIIKRNEDLNKE